MDYQEKEQRVLIRVEETPALALVAYCFPPLRSRIQKRREVAGVMDLAVPAFCARYPYATLILYRNFNTNTVAELVELLMAFDCQCPELGIWLRSIPKRVLEKTRAAVSPYGGGKPVG